MRVGRTLPPAAAPLKWADLLYGIRGLFRGERQREDLEQELKEYFGVTHVFCVNSGKAALTLILLALRELSPKKKVVLPAYTCFSVPSAVLRAGLQPKLCDINERSFDFDYDQLTQIVGEDVLCVVPGHLFGIPADLDRLRALCQPKGVVLIEDVAQAMGGRRREQLLGTIGDVGFFSLGRGKTITSGEGGIIVTNSEALAQAITKHYLALAVPSVWHSVIELFKTFLMVVLIHPALYWIPSSIPMLKLGQTFFYKDFPMTRLSSGNAGLMTKWRERLAQSVRERESVSRRFQERLQTFGLCNKRLGYLRLPFLSKNRSQRDALFARSQEQGLGLSLMYPSTLNAIDDVGNKMDRFPGAEAVAERLIAIPTHQYVSEEDVNAICGLVAAKTATEPVERLQEAGT
jgi:perosamine synthetase